jgi:hypothetical protein
MVLLLAGCQHATAPGPATPARAPSDASAPPPATGDTRYVFGWGELPAILAQPRGGSTRGAPVTLAPGRALPLPEIAAASDEFIQDRAAILALAGDYKVSFHFMESLGLAPDYQPTRPYHSWATERVDVLEDRGRFISLQHTLLMFFKNADGTVSGPEVAKHWRQDWTYEDTDLYTFRGASTWSRRRVPAAEAAGRWSLAVFQVDDSPRYEALGRWEHRGNISAWTSERAWRPLPRREHTVRQDYDVMEGIHRILLTPTGWLHEQNNLKRVAGETGEAARFVGAEIGLDRYERITAPSLVAADEYWKKTARYWAVVRRAWAEVLARHERFTLRTEVGGKKLFEEHLAYAEKLASGTPFDAADAEGQARATLRKFVTTKKPP